MATSINLTSTQARTSGPAAAHTQPSPCLLPSGSRIQHSQLHAQLARTYVVKSPPYPFNMQEVHQQFHAQPAMAYVP